MVTDVNGKPPTSLPVDPHTCPNGCGPLEPFAEVDIGVGVMQGGPRGCPVCHWTERDDPELAALAEVNTPFPDDMEEWSAGPPDPVEKETEALLRDLAEEWGAPAEGAPTRMTNGEVALILRAADELEQAKQTAEELLHQLPTAEGMPPIVRRAFEVDIV